MKILQFLDHLIPYETFLNDLSSRIVRQLKADKDDPEFISQRKAYELFGLVNVGKECQKGGFCKRLGVWNTARQTSGPVAHQTILMKMFKYIESIQSKKINYKHIKANILIVTNFISFSFSRDIAMKYKESNGSRYRNVRQ